MSSGIIGTAGADLGGYNLAVANNKSSETDQERREDSAEILKNSLLVAAIHSFFAFAIFVVGRFSWWLGLIFFVIFVINILGRLVFVGILFVIEALVIRIALRFIRVRGLNPARFEQTLERATGLFWTNVQMGSLEIYLLAITTLLGVSFFW